MTTYEIRHPEFDDISEYDKENLIEVIAQYNKWHDKHHDDGDIKRGKQSGDALWADAIFDIKCDINNDMVKKLTTLQDTQYVAGQGFSYFDIAEIFSHIDAIRNELQDKIVHPSLLNMQPELLMGILNKLEMCTRHVIQNTSIRRLRHNTEKIGALEASMLIVKAHTTALERVMQRLEALETEGSQEEPEREIEETPVKAAGKSMWDRWRSGSNEHVGVSQLLGRLEIMQNGDCEDQLCK